MTDLLHKHLVYTVSKEGEDMQTEYNFVPSTVLGNVGYHAEPNWCAPPTCSTLIRDPATGFFEQGHHMLSSRASSCNFQGEPPTCVLPACCSLVSVAWQVRCQCHC